MGTPCRIIPNAEIAKRLGLKENQSISFAEWALKIHEGVLDDFDMSGKPPIVEGIEEGGNEPLHSAKNAFIEEKRKAIGLHPIMQEIKSTDKELVNQASDIIANGKVHEMVTNAQRDGRYTFTDAEQLAISYERDAINDEYTALDDKLTKARESGNIDEVNKIESERLGKQVLLDQYDQTLKNIGSTSAKVLRARRLFVNKQFDKAVILKKIKSDAKDGEVPPELTAEVERLTKERNELTKKLDELEKSHKTEQDKLRSALEKAQVESVKKTIANKDRTPKSATDTTKVWANKVRKLKSKPIVFIDDAGVSHDITLNGASWNQLVESTAKAIEEGGKIADKIADIIKEHPLYDKLTDSERKRLAKQLQDEVESLNKSQDFNGLAEIVGENAGGELPEGLLGNIDKMFEMKVREGETDYNKITSDIHEALLPHIRDLEVTDLRDLISGYGKFKELSKDETIRAIAEMKNQMRLDAKVEATEKGQLPLRNGIERAKQSQATREKNALILKNIKEKGIEPTLTESEKASAYTSSLEAHHRRLQNAIDDIEKEISEHKRKQKTEPRKYTDERSEQLEADKKLLMKLRDELLPKEKISDAKRAENAIERTKKLNEKLDEQIENLKAGKTEEGTPIKFVNREGKTIFGIGKDKPIPIDNARLRELQNLKAGLEQEVSDLLPQSIKDQAVLNKLKTNKERKLSALESKIEKAKTDPTVFDTKKREPFKITSTDGKTIESQKAIDETNIKIKKAEKQLERIQEDWRLANRSNLEKFGDWMNAIAREGAISNPLAIPKIFSSGLLTQLSRPIENAIGMPAIKMLPKAVRENATIEGKFNFKTEKKAYQEFANSKNWQEAWSKLKTGKHREDILYGDKDFQEHYIPIKYKGKTYKINPMVSGRLHSFSKTIPYKMGYERNRMYAYQDAILKHPEYFDEHGAMTPQAQAIVEGQAYSHALGDVFLNNNKVAKSIRNYISQLERSPEKSAKVKAFALNNIFKVLNVSANYFSAGLDYIPGVGNVRAQLGARSPVEMTANRANMLARQNKRGTVGLALFAIGMATPSVFGGYGEYDEKNKKGVKSGEVKAGDYELPHWLTHTPFMIPFQLGATVRRYMDESPNKKDGVKALQNAIKGVVETNPFAYTFQTFTDAVETPKKFSQFLFDEAFGQWIPYSAAARKIGEWTDTDSSGKTIKREPSNEIIKGFEDRMKIATGIDRESVKRKKKQ